MGHGFNQKTKPKQRKNQEISCICYFTGFYFLRSEPSKIKTGNQQNLTNLTTTKKYQYKSSRMGVQKLTELFVRSVPRDLLEDVQAYDYDSLPNSGESGAFTKRNLLIDASIYWYEAHETIYWYEAHETIYRCAPAENVTSAHIGYAFFRILLNVIDVAPRYCRNFVVVFDNKTARDVSKWSECLYRRISKSRQKLALTHPHHPVNISELMRIAEDKILLQGSTSCYGDDGRLALQNIMCSIKRAHTLADLEWMVNARNARAEGITSTSEENNTQTVEADADASMRGIILFESSRDADSFICMCVEKIETFYNKTAIL